MYHVVTVLIVHGPADDIKPGHLEKVEEHDVPDLEAAQSWAAWARDWGMTASYAEVEPSEEGGG